MDDCQDFLQIPQSRWPSVGAVADLPPGFVPMRLVLQPSGASVELHAANVVLGRHSQAGVRLPLPDVSRRHCQFLFRKGGWLVQDLNSLNGTHVNGELIRERCPLNHGDALRIGGFTFTIVLVDKESALERNRSADNVLHSIYRALPQSGDPEHDYRRAS